MALLIIPRQPYDYQMGKVMQEFLADQPDWANATRIWYRKRIEGFLKHLKTEGVTSYQNVTFRHFTRYMAKIREAGWTWSSRNGAFTVISKFWGWLKDAEEISDNFFVTKANQVKRPRKVKTVVKPLKLEHAEAMIAAAEAKGTLYGIRDATLMRLLLTTGVRREEVTRLDLDHIDDRQVFIIGKYDRERFVYLPDNTAQAIEAWLQVRPATDSPALFITLHRNKNGLIHTRLGNRALNLAIQKWQERAGLPTDISMSPHKWRHLYATYFAEQHPDPFALQKLLGHSDISTTRVYVTYSQSTLKDKALQYGPDTGGSNGR